MIAAIYARKSTDQTGVADEEKSVSRQVEHARAYAVKKGWTVDSRFIFVDDGISGAEFDERPSFVRLMASLGTKRRQTPFQVLIMSEGSRLGREQFETGYALKQLSQAGVRVFHYLEDRERTLDSPMDKFIMSATAFTDEMERERASQRTADALDRKARGGFVTGGKTFGYDNVQVSGGKRHVINEAETEVVRRIYQMYADGSGYRHIAHELNAQRVPSPRAQRGRPSGWDQGTVRCVLERMIYRGVFEYKKTKKRDTWGKQTITARPASDLIRVEKPECRIISPELEAIVDARRTDRKQRYLRGQHGQLIGQPVLGKYLLSGLLRCTCGANFEAQKSPHGMRKGEVYVCSAHRRKGPAVCASRLALPIAETDNRILNVIEGQVLQPMLIEAVLRTVFVADEADRPSLEAEREDLERQMENLTAAVKAGGDIPSLVTELKITNARLVDIRRRLEPQEHHDREQLRLALEQRVEEWRTILRANPAQARQVLAQVLGPIMVTVEMAAVLSEPAMDGFNARDQRGKEGITLDDIREGLAAIRWTATTKPSGLLAGLSVVQRMASPTGFEPVFWP